MNKKIKFKVGDKIKGISNSYPITDKDMHLGKIEEVKKYAIKVLILDHKIPYFVGEKYWVHDPEGRFEIVERKNGKFFKKLPNDFSGTLEVENGYILEKEILDDVEKEYLSAVIKPFKNKVKSIIKTSGKINGEYICICIYDDCSINFPFFKKGTMYKGMEVGKQYTLEELGL